MGLTVTPAFSRVGVRVGVRVRVRARVKARAVREQERLRVLQLDARDELHRLAVGRRAVGREAELAGGGHLGRVG